MFGRISTSIAVIAAMVALVYVAVIVAMVALVACSTVPTAQPPQPSEPSPPGLDTISREAEPGLYTKAFVAEAIRLYDADGRDATIALYNSPESMDGEWYLFIIDKEGLVLAHSAIPENVGLTVKEPLGIDSNGYDFGAALLAATEQGGWVSYVYENPTRGNFLETKHAWVINHDGLIFGSGWYQVIRYDAPPQQITPEEREKVIAQLDH